MTIKEQRLIALEEEVSHLRMANEELSSEVLAQWKRIESLERQLANLENRLTSFEDHLDSPPENTKPPHW